MYRILQEDALDYHWIDLYNSTIYKNFALFKFLFYGTEDDYTRIYNFFIENQLSFVHPVSSRRVVSKTEIFLL